MTTTIEDIDKTNQYRLIQAGAAHVTPILAKRRADTLARMVAKYKSGEREFVGEAAELSVILDIESQLKQNHAKLTRLEEKANERNT